MQAKIARNKWLDFGIPLFILTLISVLFRFTDWDLQLQRMFYTAEEGWYKQDTFPWHYIFYYGNILGLLLVLVGLAVLSMSFWSAKYRKLRKKAIFLVAVFALGPGLLVNFVLKEHWGRPRPRAIEEFGGKEVFKCVCQDGFQGKGKSFPCGHCSMAFYLLLPYFVYRHNKKLLARLFLSGGIAYGLLMGLSRMIAGGHFASDVLWAGGLVYLIGVGLDHLMRLDIEPEVSLPKAAKRKSLPIIISILAAHVVLFGILLATPYKRQSQFPLDTDGILLADFNSHSFQFHKANVQVRLSDKTRASWKAQGFGFPGTRLNPHWRESSPSGMPIFWLDPKGIFTEFNMQLDLELFSGANSHYLLQLQKGSVVVGLGKKLDRKLVVDVELAEGQLVIDTKTTPEFVLQSEQAGVINQSGVSLEKDSTGAFRTSAQALLYINLIGGGEAIIH